MIYAMLFLLAVLVGFRGLSWGFIIPLVAIALSWRTWRKSGRRWWVIVALIAWFGYGLWSVRI